MVERLKRLQSNKHNIVVSNPAQVVGALYVHPSVSVRVKCNKLQKITEIKLHSDILHPFIRSINVEFLSPEDNNSMYKLFY